MHDSKRCSASAGQTCCGAVKPLDPERERVVVWHCCSSQPLDCAPLIAGRSFGVLVGSALVLAVHCTCCLMASRVLHCQHVGNSCGVCACGFLPWQGSDFVGWSAPGLQPVTTANKYNTYPHTDIYATFLSFMPILLLLCYISWMCCATLKWDICWCPVFLE